MQFWIEQLEERNLLNGTSLLSDGDFETNPESWGAVFSDFEIRDDESFEGQSSAASINRTSSYGGLYSEISGIAREGVLYEVSAWVRVVNEDGQPIRLGIEQFDEGGYRYTELETHRSLEANQWKKLSGTFSFESNGNLNSLKIKIDGPAAGVEFLVDDVRLSDPTFRLNTNLQTNSSFESGMADWFGWNANISSSSAESFRDDSSAFVSARSQDWQGIATDASPYLRDGFAYTVSAKIFVIGSSGEDIQLGVKQVDDAGERYVSIDFRGAVEANQWLTLSGQFELSVDWRWAGAILSVNGEIEDTGLGGAVMGHPAHGICWVCKRFAPHGIALEPGQIVLSGSFTRPVAVNAGDSVHADYGPLGDIRVDFV